MRPAITAPFAIAFVTDRSACVPVRVMTVALLSEGSGSTVSEVTLAVFVIVVPAGVPGNTRNTREKIAEEPAGIVSICATSVLPGKPAPNGGPES